MIMRSGALCKLTSLSLMMPGQPSSQLKNLVFGQMFHIDTQFSLINLLAPSEFFMVHPRSYSR